MFSTFTLFFYCYITTQFLLNCHPLFSNNLHSDVGSCTWEDIRDLRESFQKLERHSDQCSHLFKKGMQVFNTIKGEKQVVNIISYIFIFRIYVFDRMYYQIIKIHNNNSFNNIFHKISYNPIKATIISNSFDFRRGLRKILWSI